MNTPNDRLYASTHEWVKISGDEAVIGITAFAQEQLGDITFVELPAIGAALRSGQELGSVESVKAAGDIYAPVGGEVLEVNAELASAPERINESPYDKGWLVRVRLAGTPSDLLSAQEYDALLASSSH